MSVYIIIVTWLIMTPITCILLYATRKYSHFSTFEILTLSLYWPLGIMSCFFDVFFAVITHEKLSIQFLFNHIDIDAIHKYGTVDVFFNNIYFNDTQEDGELIIYHYSSYCIFIISENKQEEGLVCHITLNPALSQDFKNSTRHFFKKIKTLYELEKLFKEITFFDLPLK